MINKQELLRQEGPLLIAANHPNSFLDAIILATLFKNPVYSLARGDAFANRIITKILTSFNMLPVYRVSEGVENLENNYDTFNACQDIFKKNGIVLIFSEGRCINEWRLRPLKKGTARLALEAWQNDIPLRVLPLGINYSSFRKFGKIIHLNFGTLISKAETQENYAGKEIISFNQKLKNELEKLVFEIDINDRQKRNKYFQVKKSVLKYVILFIPSILGFILHLPLYLAIHFSIKNRAEDHYDSVMTGLLFFIYPFYVFLICVAGLAIFKSWLVLILLIAIPFTLWSYVQLNGR
ncbi:MAG: 1-acyl-sn-glycerol-3-phosphate acyltransferase [Ginsengibacter sp.]